MNISLKGKNALIGGSSRGLGYAVARQLAISGASVTLMSRNEKKLKEIVANLENETKIKHNYLIVDFNNFDSYKEKISTFLSDNPIDILVNNAGVTRDTLIMRMSEDDWNTVININLKGAFNGIKAVTRVMMKQRSGRIINISSVSGLMGNPGQANYSASKAGVIGLSKATAKELASRGITVNCIAPGYIATDMTNKMTDQAKDSIISQIPLGRMGSPEDIAAAALFLASNEAGYITGQTFTVDGGMVMI